MNQESQNRSGAEYADSVRAVLDHAARVEASEGMQVEARPPFLTRPPVVVALLVVFAGVVVWNIRTLTTPAEPLPPAEEAVSLRMSAVVVTQLIEAYRDEHGSLPASLDALGVPVEGFEYIVTGDSYELRVSGASEEISLDGTPDPQELLQGLDLPPVEEPGR